MKFEEFLITEINKQLPIDKLKQDLSYFKNAFNYASKTDTLYNNLIDNIVFILQRKFNRFDIIYKNSEVMYNELLLTLSPQIPQFLMIQKKQLLESLDTFADLNNWGEILKDNIKRDLNLSSSGENTTNFLPIDGTEKDPYSTNDVQSNETQGENTNVNRNVANYLDFYENITWNIADLELEKILKPYYKMFKLYYAKQSTEQVGGGGGDYSELEKRVETLEQTTEVIINEVEQNMEKIDNNTASIEDNKTQIDANKEQIEQIDQELSTFAKLGLENTFTAPNKFRDNVQILSDKTLELGWEPNDIKLKLSTGSANKEGIVESPQGDLLLKCKEGKNIFINQSLNAQGFTIFSLPTPHNPTDAVNKKYVDDLYAGSIPSLTNYYTKSESDSRFAKLDGNNNLYGNQSITGVLDIKGSGNNVNNYARFFNFDYNNANFTALKFINNGVNKLQIQTNNNTGESVISTGGEDVLRVTNLQEPQTNNDASTKYYVDENRRVVELKLTNDYYTKEDADKKYGIINAWNEWTASNTFNGNTYFNIVPQCKIHYDESFDWFCLVNKEYVNNWMKFDTVQSPELQWVSTAEDYGWTYMTKVTKSLKIKKRIYSCSIEWKSSASDSFRRQCVANAWIDYNTKVAYISFVFSSTMKPDPYNNLLNAIQTIYITGY